MKKLILLLAFAAVACAPSPEKPDDKVTVTARGLTLEVATAADGTPVLLDQWQAYEHCHKKGARLPTVREMTDYATNFGTRGILERCETNRGCNPIVVTNPDMRVEFFFYDANGYQAPTDARGKNWFWTSSYRAVITGYPYERYEKDSKYPNWEYSGTFRFNGYYGTFDIGTRHDSNAVMCVKL